MDLQERLDELKGLGLHRRMRLVSGPQGPRVVLDGKPVLVLCSNNYLGLADHPRVREAAAEAAMRWGVGTGSSRVAVGTMTVHGRLEERLATFMGTEAAVLFGSGYLANVGVVAALAEPGGVVLADERCHLSLSDGCALARAETQRYRHADMDHLAALARASAGRPLLIVTDAVFGTDGDVAPLEEIVEIARRRRARLVVDDAHGVGCLGPDGRGAVAEAGLEGEVDVVVGSLGKALGSYGAFAACEAPTARFLVNRARTLLASTAPPPPAVAGALAALELLREQPHRVDKLQANAEALRAALEREGLGATASTTQIVPLEVGDAVPALRLCEAALERGVFAEPVRPPTVAAGASRVRLTVTASHTKDELRGAARILAHAAAQVGVRPALAATAATARPVRPFDGQAAEPPLARAA